jgi:protein-S-isoprenylcysteine O-methyltransferase Ste14
MTSISSQTESHSPKSAVLIFAALVVLSAVLGVAAYFGAQRLNWTLEWLYLGLLFTTLIVSQVCALSVNPVLFARRAFPGRGIKRWDIACAITFLLLVVATYFVARYDLNAKDLPPGPHGIAWLVGATMMVFGVSVFAWAMMVNPFFEKWVRIQSNHGHHVIDRGPYACVRHPGYVGLNILLLATPLLLHSAWTTVPSVLMVLSVVARTGLEDRTLVDELDGYSDYAKRVRYRLIPGLW